MVGTADWRTAGPVDMSTNPWVSLYYGGRKPLVFRTDNRQEIYGALATGDTLRIGLDYNVLLGSSDFLLPPGTVHRHARQLNDGKVVVLRAFWTEEEMVFVSPDGHAESVAMPRPHIR